VWGQGEPDLYLKAQSEDIISPIIYVKSLGAHLPASVGSVKSADGGVVSNISRKCSVCLCTQTDLSERERRGVSASIGDGLCLWWAS